MKRVLTLCKNPYVILGVITFAFFWQVFIKGFIPFPADLLLAEYNPWRHTSYFGYVPGSIPNKAQYFDVIRELYPWKTLVIEQIKKGIPPLWNPYNFSGAPLMANYQSQTFYPLGILYFVLPQHVAWTALIILQILLGSYFMYLFASSIGLSLGASLLASVVFNYSSFSTVWLEFNTVWHTILWIPLILYLVEKRLISPFSIKQKILFVFAIFSSMTAGHPQDFINSMLLVFTYAAARIYFAKNIEKPQKMIISTQLAILAFISFLMGAIQLLPTIHLFTTSARVSHDVQFIINNMLLQFWQLPLIVMSDFFGNPATRTYVLNDTFINKSLSIGVIGFLLGSISFVSKKTFHTRYFQLIAGVLLILSTNNPISQLFYRFPIPLLSTGTPTRNLFIYIFSLSILAAVGYDELKKHRQYRKAIFVVISVFALIFVCYVLNPTLLYSFVPITVAAMKKTFILSTFILTGGLFCIIASNKLQYARFGLILIACAELYIGFMKFNAFVPPSYIFPQNELFTYLQKNAGLSRFWGYGTAQIEANFATQYHVYSPDGTDPLNLSWYNSFVQSSDKGQIVKTFTRSTRSDASIKTGYGETDLPENTSRLRVMDALGVKYVFDRVENPKGNNTFDPARFIPVQRMEDWTIFENLEAAPRYFLSSRVIPYTSDKEFETHFFDKSFDPKRMILLQSNDYTHPVEAGEYKQQIDLLLYSPSEVRFRIYTQKPQYLFLSDTYDTGWKSYINGQKTQTYKANYAFRAIYIPEGEHDIVMRYLPDEFIIGAIGSLLGIFLLVAYIYASRSNQDAKRING